MESALIFFFFKLLADSNIFVKGIYGKFVGDKEYISKKLFECRLLIGFIQ